MRHALLLLVVLLGLPAWAADKSAFPRYASLKVGEVNVRAGPGSQYPILWVYKQESYPVKLLAEFENWYKIRDVEGEEGWVFRNFVSSRRTTVVSPGTPVPLYRDPGEPKPLLFLEAGVLATLGECEGAYCALRVKNYKGWAKRGRLLMVDGGAD
jgi:SH3-like domain-containing protein